MQISSLTFLFKLSWGWQRVLNQACHFRDNLEKHGLKAPLKDVISTSVGPHLRSKQMLCQLIPAECSESLVTFENGRLLKQEIQFTRICQLESRTKPPQTWIHKHECTWTEPFGQWLGDLSSFILGIHTVPLSSQSLCGKRRKDKEPRMSPWDH